MTTRVTGATLKRLAAIEQQREQGRTRRKVVKLPVILSIEDWEAVALRAQRALVAAAAEDIAFVQPGAATAAAPSAPYYGPIEDVHFHRPDPNRHQAPVPRPPRAPKVYDE